VVFFVRISGLVTSVLAVVAKGDGADDDSVGVKRVEVEEKLIDELFIRRNTVDCVVDIFVDLVICIGWVLFIGLIDIVFLMTGDQDSRTV